MNTTALPVCLCIALAGAGCAPTSIAGNPRYGVCRAEMEAFVRDRLGQTVTRIEVRDYSERTPPVSVFDPGSALVYVEECSGFHAFEIRGTETLCEHIPHYGGGGTGYVRYEGGFDGCQRH